MLQEQPMVNRTTPLWWLFLPVALLVLVYLPALSDLVSTWIGDDNYSHGFLIPAISGYLLWKKREQLVQVPRKVEPFGIVFLVAAMGLFVVANGAAEYFTLRVSLVMALFGTVWYFFGRGVVRLTWFEILFLLFMIPIPYVLYYSATFPMQALASRITVVILDLMGATVVRRGNIIHIAEHSLEVAEACSGIRSLMALLALGALYAYTSQRTMTGKILLFLSTIPIAVVANVVRVLLTALIVYLVTPAVTEEPWHSGMGLLVFLVAFILMFITGAILKRVLK